MNYESISPETLKTEYLSPENCSFFIGDAGFTGAVIKNETHNRVILKRALPFGAPDDYICITDTENNELGIIEHVAAFSDQQQKIIGKELSLRYFIPVIQEIVSIKEKMGHFYFDVKIQGISKSFTVKDLSKNVRMHGENIDITDIDGNRYRITDFSAIAAKSRRKLEPYLY
ncbi:MAG: DUF1854 domain-containing protein [Clostridia bacterium]|nr:DUF1854 domain-containing protein [Clostridia bacterium]MBR5423278.1 DUF1854 domain-containing protein [Clostridia bacterium]